MKTIPELLKLYEDFFKALSAKLNKDSDNPAVRSEEFETPTDSQIDEFAKQYNVLIPEDVKTFWKQLKVVYTAAIFEEPEWEAGWDFVPLNIISRDTKMLRDLANNYEDGDAVKKLHQTGVQLTYEEPILLFDANPKTKKGTIHHLLWDGTSIPDAIAPDFRTFFEHWLATGCFRGRNFEAYWKIVKDIVPVKIPLKDNLWVQYRKKQDEPKGPSDPEAMAHLDKVGKAYDDGNNAIKVWRSGKEAEAAVILKNVIATAKQLGDNNLAVATVCNYAGLSSESGRNADALQIMQNFFKEDEKIANENSKALRLLGQYLYENGMFDEGLKWCNKSVIKGPKDAWGYYTRACAHIRLKNLNEALADITKAIECDANLREEIANDKDFLPLKDMPEFKKAVSKK